MLSKLEKKNLWCQFLWMLKWSCLKDWTCLVKLTQICFWSSQISRGFISISESCVFLCFKAVTLESSLYPASCTQVAKPLTLIPSPPAPLYSESPPRCACRLLNVIVPLVSNHFISVTLPLCQTPYPGLQANTGCGLLDINKVWRWFNLSQCCLDRVTGFNFTASLIGFLCFDLMS